MLDVNIELIENMIEGLGLLKRLGEADNSLTVPASYLSPRIAHDVLGLNPDEWLIGIPCNIFNTSVNSLCVYGIENGSDVIKILSKHDPSMLDYFFEMCVLDGITEQDDVNEYFSGIDLYRMDFSSSLITQCNEDSEAFVQYIPRIVEEMCNLEQNYLIGVDLSKDNSIISIFYIEGNDSAFAEHIDEYEIGDALVDLIRREASLKSDKNNIC